MYVQNVVKDLVSPSFGKLCIPLDVVIVRYCQPRLQSSLDTSKGNSAVTSQVQWSKMCRGGSLFLCGWGLRRCFTGRVALQRGWVAGGRVGWGRSRHLVLRILSSWPCCPGCSLQVVFCVHKRFQNSWDSRDSSVMPKIESNPYVHISYQPAVSIVFDHVIHGSRCLTGSGHWHVHIVEITSFVNRISWHFMNPDRTQIFGSLYSQIISNLSYLSNDSQLFRFAWS